MRWILSEPCDSIDLFDDMSPVASQLLANRMDGLDLKNISSFFDPKLSSLYSPDQIKNMKKATDRIVDAVKKNEKIAIHGDYDADGITSTYILYKTLEAVGANVTYKLPNRSLDGYGVSSRFVEECIENPCLVVTVDCGVSEYKKIQKLKSAGIDVIVTDHHKVGSKGIPDGVYTVVDPHQEDETCPFISYAGVGVSFMLCWSICKAMPENIGDLKAHLKSLIPYVAIGTIADVMPLKGENRTLVSVGLKMMQNGEIENGVKNLIDISGLSLESITAKDIGFMVAPRINSAGRMADPSVSLDCFLSGNRMVAAKLNGLNEQRKEISQSLSDEAVDIIESNTKIKEAPILVVAGKEWHSGVIGIVAGRIAELYGKPSIVFSIADGKARGSGRSVQDFNLYAAVSCAVDLLNSFGGHAQALGVSLDESKIDEFRDRLSSLFEESDGEEPSLVAYRDGPPLTIDCEVNLSIITPELMREIDRLGPFGEGNPEPVLAVKNVSILDYRSIGKDKNHLSLTVIQDGCSLRGVAFNATNLIELLDEGNSKMDVAFTPIWNTFNGRTSLEMRIKDMKIPD